MAYLPWCDTVVLQIAKSGSSSLVKAASSLGELTHVGHLPASAHPVASRYVAVVRDPVDRLISALNYYYGPGDVDDVLRHALRYRTGQSAFKPQTWYMDMPCETYDLADMRLALSSIGHVGDVPKENVSLKWLTLGMAEKSKYWPRLIQACSPGMYR